MNGYCRFCGKPILWVTLEEGPKKGKSMPVEPEPVFALGDARGPRTYYTAEGELFRGDETETDAEKAEVVFVPHRCKERGIAR